MTEEGKNLEWQQTSLSAGFAEKLQELMDQVVVSELKDITGKIDTLCAMGLMQEGPELEQIREKLNSLNVVRKKDNADLDK